MQKLGQAMGLSAGEPGEAATTTELSGPEETEEDAGEEDESIVHHTASVGDVEVFSIKFNFDMIANISSLFFRNKFEG